ncbi:MAG: ATP synthase subunit I [Clostridium sp.]|nr:ATP synthase subunit I [Clostridium sp.]MCM1461013.1 ATP synthase subunit I [Bacteroides sp.]
MQLYIGIGIYFAVFGILGVIFMRPIWLFIVSLFVGCAAACFIAYNMYDVLDRALELETGKAKSFVTIRSMIRLVVCLVLMAAGIMVDWVSFVGVTVGLLGLKVSAFLNPVVRKITGDVTAASEKEPSVDIEVSDGNTEMTGKEITAKAVAELEAAAEDHQMDDDYEDELIKKYFKKYTEKYKDRYM